MDNIAMEILQRLDAVGKQSEINSPDNLALCDHCGTNYLGYIRPPISE